MPAQEAYRAATTVFSLYGGLFQDLVQEIGLERALELHARQGARFGAGIAALTEARSSGAQLEFPVLCGTMCAVHDALGVKRDTDQQRESVTYTCEQCPMYEGLRNSGLDHETVRRMCTQMTEREFAALKSKYPNLWGSMEFRETADSPCVERFVKVW